MADGSILPGEHRKSDSLFKNNLVSMGQIENIDDEDITSNLQDFKDI